MSQHLYKPLKWCMEGGVGLITSYQLFEAPFYRPNLNQSTSPSSPWVTIFVWQRRHFTALAGKWPVWSMMGLKWPLQSSLLTCQHRHMMIHSPMETLVQCLHTQYPLLALVNISYCIHDHELHSFLFWRFSSSCSAFPWWCSWWADTIIHTTCSITTYPILILWSYWRRCFSTRWTVTK